MKYTTGFTKSQFDAIVARVQQVFHDAGPSSLGRPRKLNARLKIMMTLQYLRGNSPQRLIAEQYHISQTLVSHVIKEITREILVAFESFLPTLEDLAENTKRQTLIVDGTLVSCGKHAYNRYLYSGKHKQIGFNVQVISNISGSLVYVSDPLPGRMHDSRAIRAAKIMDVLDPKNTLADKAYQGLGIITPKKQYGHNRHHEQFNRTVNSIRSAVERCIAHLKNWKILSTRYKRPHHTLKQTLQTITILEILRTTF